ncbi:MAG: hypothetical protein ABL993_09105 [Vicinamibacterales bacterium]
MTTRQRGIREDADSMRRSAATDRALRRLIAEIHDGLRHGYFEYRVTCDIVNHERRRVVIYAGKTYQFTIPKDECVRCADSPGDSSNGSDGSAN